MPNYTPSRSFVYGKPADGGDVRAELEAISTAITTSVSGVSSVFGRTGAVTAANNDYTWAQIDKTTSDIADITTKSHTSLTDIGTNTHAQIDTHVGSTSNPHSVTKAQVGLTNVEDTALSTWAGSTNLITLGTVTTGTWGATAITHEKGGLEADVSAYDGLIKITGGSTSNIKCNFAASTAPTTTDDSSAGYSVGSLWIDTTNDKEYVCVDATASAAQWSNGEAAYDWKGAWATSTAYALNDCVENNGSGYVCTQAHTSGASTEPGTGASWTSYWDIFTQGSNLTAGDGISFNAGAVDDDLKVDAGWWGAGEAWTYASATTFTISGDLTAKYQVGDKIKFTQTSVKYFYIVGVSYSSPNTTVTVTGGSDYTVANAAITSPYYSKIENPQGFPHWFDYTVTWTTTGTAPSIGNGTLSGRFCMVGKKTDVKITFTKGSTTSLGSGSWRWSIPITASNSPHSMLLSSGRAQDVGTANFYAQTCSLISTTTVGIHQTDGTQWANNQPSGMWANGDIGDIYFSYEVP